MKNIKKNLICLFIVSILLCACSKEKVNVIKLDANQDNKLKISYTTRIIQLETNKESFLQFIFKINVDKINDRIFVLSNFNIYMFNMDGKYLTKLKIGKGPGEITRIVAFTINPDTKSIYAIDNSTRLIMFDYNGNMKNEYRINNFASTDLCILDDNNILLLRNFVGIEENYFMGMFNLTAKKITRKFIPAEKSPYPKNSIATAINFSNNNGKIYLNIPNVFGLFEFRNDHLNQLFSLDLGNRKVPNSLVNKCLSNSKYCNLRDEAKTRSYVPFLLYGFHFKDYYFTVIDDKNMNCYAINKRNNRIYNNGALYTYFNLPAKESLKLLGGIQNNLLIFYSNPSDFFELEDQSNTKEIQINDHIFDVAQNDNPFLILVE